MTTAHELDGYVHAIHFLLRQATTESSLSLSFSISITLKPYVLSFFFKILITDLYPHGFWISLVLQLQPLRPDLRLHLLS